MATEIFPTDELRDIILELREEQERSRRQIESIVRRLARIAGDLPKPRIIEFSSPFKHSKTNRST